MKHFTNGMRHGVFNAVCNGDDVSDKRFRTSTYEFIDCPGCIDVMRPKILEKIEKLQKALTLTSSKLCLLE